MRSSTILAPSLLIITSLLQPIFALKALSDSPCATKCGNVLGSTVGANDIVCEDSDYTSAIGSTFSGCVGCQLSSSYVEPSTNETDLQWGLYNIRYAMSYCLWGFPNNPDSGSTPCTTSLSCGPYQDVIQYGNLSATDETEYGYCTDFSDYYVPSCQNCLKIATTEFYINNFWTLLYGACNQKPEPGTALSFQGSPFSTTTLNMTTPSPSSIAAKAYPGLSLNGRIGVAVGAIVLILFVSGFCIVCQGRRRRRRALRKHQLDTGYAGWKDMHDTDGLGGHIPVAEAHSASSNMTGSYFESPNSAKPLQPGYWGQIQPHGGNAPSIMIPVDESPVSTVGEKAYLSPYSSQYSSPATASTEGQGRNPHGDQWPMDRKSSFGSFGSGSLGTGGGSMAEKLKMRERERERKKRLEEAAGERIELQNVAPVLSHPGFGRGETRGMTSEDLRRGDAF